ncbi:MAG: hypothetical protein HY782_06890 [Chloroflexi bacterium]|nr:hypothetical protein [Chloroflexota bacterium]
MAEPKLVKTVVYEVQDIDLSQAIRDNPQVEELRQEVVRWLNVLQEAKAKQSESTVVLDKSAVPPVEATRGCAVCEYTKVVNFIPVETWPPVDDRAIGGCGSCGTRIQVSEHVVNFKLVEQIVEGWKLIQP